MKNICSFYKTVYAIFGILLVSSHVTAQSISLNQVNATYGDSGDYFTDVLNRPRDFNDVCDLIDDQHYYSTKRFSNSVWTGASSGKTGPVFSISHVPISGTAIPFIPDCGENLFTKNISAANYHLLSVKNRFSTATNFSALLWNVGRGQAVNGGFMGIGSSTGSPKMVVNRWAANWFTLQGNPGLTQTWQGEISGLSFAPAVPFPLNATAELDWFRLVNLNNTNWLRLQWQTNNNGVQTPRVSIYLDNDPLGYDGMVIFENESTASYRDMALGMVPPGTYYIYASLDNVVNSNSISVAKSNYIGPIVINAKPQITVTSPSMYSGIEYGRDERRDPWDFNSLGDLSNVPINGSNPPQSFRYFSNYGIDNEVFYATSDRVTAQVAADVQMHPSINKNNPIRTSMYRYFCARMQIDPRGMPRDGNLQRLNDAGWFARVMYFNSKDPNTFGSTRGFHLYETSSSFPDLQNGFMTYCLDLWDPQNHDSGKTFREVPIVDALRFDPHEALEPTRFGVDHIGLYSENITNSSEQYTVTWNTKDQDTGNHLTKIYVDTNNTGFDGTLVGEAGYRTSGDNAHTINLSALAEGYYYVYIEAYDGVNTSRAYSNVPIKKTSQKYVINGAPKKSPCDADGDGISDTVLVRSVNSNAQWLSFNTSTGVPSQFWGYTNQDVFLDSDYDADLKLDKLAVRKSAQYQWWIQRSSGPSSGGFWGQPGDFPVVADFDGDGATDTSIFRESDGSWWTILSKGGVSVQSWGLPGDLPVHADYDGDTISDYAIWRPSIGYWAVIKSSNNYSNQAEDVIWKQWGLGGDLPMTGDYTGDGVADLVVWRPVDGTWYICRSETGFNCAQPTTSQFGLYGDYPISFDADGNGVLDYAVYRPRNGTWYVKNSQTGVIQTRQFGLSGDYPVCTSHAYVRNFTR